MSKSRSMGPGYLAGLVMTLLFCAGSSMFVLAQEEGSGFGKSTFDNGEAAAKLPIKHTNNAKLTEQQIRGAGVFIQHCALCHLNKTNKACCAPSVGPNLGILYKNATPEQEKMMREVIMNGGPIPGSGPGPSYMPAWKYGLKATEVDDIIAYLKTLD